MTTPLLAFIPKRMPIPATTRQPSQILHLQPAFESEAAVAPGARFLPLPIAKPPPRPLAPHNLRATLALVEGYPRLVAAVTTTAGCVLFAFATTVVSLLRLPALVLAAPWALSLSLVAAGVVILRRARERLGTGGIDPDLERRILELAILQKGRVTTTAVAHELAVPLRIAEAALSALTKAGFLTVETHPASGAILYVSPEIDAGLVPLQTRTTGVAFRDDALLPAPPSNGAEAPTLCGLVRVSHKSKLTAALLAICGGALGAHKFYLGQPVAGLLYLLMFWTFVPTLFGFLEGIRYLAMTDHAFDLKHNARLV